MKALVCEHCGGDEFTEKDGHRICMYCKSRFIIPKEEKPSIGVSISLNDDIKNLLEKCKRHPGRAHYYASLILDIDPTNKDALKYL